MKSKLIAASTAAVFALLPWPMPGEQPDSPALKQLKATAKNTATMDGGSGSTINTSARTTTTVVPAVQTSSAAATSQQRQQQAIQRYNNSVVSPQAQQAAIDRYKNSGPASVGPTSIKTKTPPSPVVTQPKPAPKPGGSVPTGR
jgi:hypothetical protein